MAAFGWLAGWGWAGQRTHTNTVHVNSISRQNNILLSHQSAGIVFWLIFLCYTSVQFFACAHATVLLSPWTCMASSCLFGRHG